MFTLERATNILLDDIVPWSYENKYSLHDTFENAKVLTDDTFYIALKSLYRTQYGKVLLKSLFRGGKISKKDYDKQFR